MCFCSFFLLLCAQVILFDEPLQTLTYQIEGFDMRKFQQDLRHYEGVRYTIYPDPLHGASHATVGVGHLLIRGDKHYGHSHPIFLSICHISSI